jgi:tape measure domain-containing protein
MDQQIRYTVTANDMLSGQLQGMNQNAQALEGTMGNLGNVIAGAFSVYAVSSFVKSVVSAGTTVENATTGLTTLLGDASEASRVVQNTMQDATKTPFAFEGLLSANKALIGAGVNADKARADVLNLANAISATGGGDDELGRMVVNMQQISNTGKATAQDIKQFAFAGINIYKVLAESTGQPIAKVKEMEISYDMLTMALSKAHDEGGIYYNGLENMAGNTSVRISNVGDAVFQFMNDIFIETKPLIDMVLNSVLDLVAGTRNLVTFIKEHQTAVKVLGVFIGSIVTVMILYNAQQKLSAMYTAFTTASFIANTFATGAMTAGFAGASAGGMVLAGVMALINAVNPFAWIAIAIGAVVTAVYYCYQEFETFRGVVWAIGGVIKAYVGIWADMFSGLGQILKGVFNLDVEQIKAGFNKITDTIKTSAMRLGKSAKDGYTAGIGDFAKDNAKASDPKATKKGLEGVKPMAINAGAGANAGAGKATKGTSGVSGSKVVTVNVTIGNLINDFRIQTTNIQESTTAIKDKVLQALTSAVNDSQLVAGS